MNNAQKLRKLYKKTQDEISDIIEYPKPLYAAFELNRMQLPKEKLSLLAEFYNVTTEYLTK
jgi:transcriptional regulator with XRE-family HTH domain